VKRDVHPRVEAGPAEVAPPRARETPATLALFVGNDCRPGHAEFETLGRDGMRCLWVADCDEALRAARLAQFDALVIDTRALGTRRGVALTRLRLGFDCPLLVVADRHDEVDEIMLLELGADAYLERPIAPRRLSAHLGVLGRLRTRSGDSEPAALALAADEAREPWRLDRVANRLVGPWGAVGLTELQCALLQCLHDAAGRVVARAALADALPLGREVHARSIDVYMHRLRRRLADAAVIGWTIETVRNRGYWLRVSAA
jgi:DNA-binding response OmpR family regulator